MENKKASKDYSNGRIYIIRNTVNDKVYIGSTTQPLSKRMAGHREASTIHSKIHLPLYKAFDDVGKHNFYIELLENCPCGNLEQLRKREGEFIREYNSCNDGYNQRVAGRNAVELRNDKIEAIKAREKQYRDANKDVINQRSKVHYNANKETVLKRCKLYKEANKDKIKEENKQYYENHKDLIKQKRQVKINCPHCGLEMCKDSIYKHIKSKHPIVS
jgi:group I intron endonuclease